MLQAVSLSGPSIVEVRNDSIVVLRLLWVEVSWRQKWKLGVGRIVKIFNYTKDSRDKEFFVKFVVRVRNLGFVQNVT